MNIQNLNFDPSPYGLFYGMTAVCMLLLFGMWRLYLRNESLEEYGQLTDDFDKSAIAASTELMARINSQIVEINYLQREITTERTERFNLGFEIVRLQDELKDANSTSWKAIATEAQRQLVDIGELKEELAKTEDARLFLEKSNNTILNKYNKLRKEFKELHDLHQEVPNIATESETKPTDSKTDAPIDYSTWSDEELLKKAYNDYGLGVKFKSIFSDRGKKRTVKEFEWESAIIKDEAPTYEIERSESKLRCIRALNGMNVNDGCCSNPVMYTDKRGWCPIIKEEAAPEYYDTIEEIKAGDKFICFKEHSGLSNEGKKWFIVGKTYTSFKDGTIRSEGSGGKYDYWFSIDSDGSGINCFKKLIPKP